MEELPLLDFPLWEFSAGIFLLPCISSLITEYEEISVPSSSCLIIVLLHFAGASWARNAGQSLEGDVSLVSLNLSDGRWATLGSQKRAVVNTAGCGLDLHCFPALRFFIKMFPLKYVIR
jgi:hypothetical protein